MSLHRRATDGLRKAGTSPAVHAAIHSVFVTAIVGLLIMSVGEDRAYKTIVDRVTADTMSEREEAIALLHAAHELTSARNRYLTRVKQPGVRTTWFHSGDLQLMTGGACGSHTHMMARLLDQAGIGYRVMQMLCEPKLKSGACHVLLEAKISGRWIVLDPLYDLYFTTRKGKLATFASVREDWGYFVKQVPQDYNRKLYTYDGRRYTNWKKIPVVMPVIKEVMGYVGVKKLSIRSYVLNLYKTYAVIVGLLEAFMICLTAYTFVRMPKNKE